MSAAIPTGPQGVLVVDKPAGPTSFRIVADARKLFGTRAVGHAGTLDPMASGVLLILLGEATKLSGYLTAASKTYLATVSFGQSTDSFDAEGQVTESRGLKEGWLKPAQLDAALAAELARKTQLPPAFSAIKLDGRPAYALARAGKPPELAARPVSVHSLRLTSVSPTELQLELHVSKGYYVRSLARDLCAALGVPGHLSGLRRTSSGAFTLDEACPWVSNGPRPELMPVSHAARRGLPCVALRSEAVLLARQGKRLRAEDFAQPPPPDCAFGWLDGERLVAIGESAEEGFRVLRGFNV